MILVFFVISVWHLYRISRIIYNLKRTGIIAIIACVHVTMVARTAIAAPTVICNNSVFYRAIKYVEQKQNLMK